MVAKFDVWNYVAPNMMMQMAPGEDDATGAFRLPASPWVAG